MAIHSEKLAVISTGHLPEGEAKELTEAINDGAISALQREEGWMVFTHNYIGDMGALSFVLGYLRARGFDWVLFDCDAEPTDELPTYEW